MSKFQKVFVEVILCVLNVLMLAMFIKNIVVLWQAYSADPYEMPNLIVVLCLFTVTGVFAIASFFISVGVLLADENDSAKFWSTTNFVVIALGVVMYGISGFCGGLVSLFYNTAEVMFSFAMSASCCLLALKSNCAGGNKQQKNQVKAKGDEESVIQNEIAKLKEKIRIKDLEAEYFSLKAELERKTKKDLDNK
ncbi:MAG: hypothetical protein J6J24_04940 [Clostridia bacterium]|nr:hypothetical protein [Clostridia bacterium]